MIYISNIDCRAPLVTIVRILFHHFLSRTSILDAYRDTGISRNTISNIYSFARLAIHTQQIH
jgi:hypothetical protein